MKDRMKVAAHLESKPICDEYDLWLEAIVDELFTTAAMPNNHSDFADRLRGCLCNNVVTDEGLMLLGRSLRDVIVSGLISQVDEGEEDDGAECASEVIDMMERAAHR